MRRVVADVVASVRNWSRSHSGVFFTIAFPVLLMLVFGAIFDPSSASLPVVVEDRDGSPQSEALVAALEGEGVLQVTRLDASASTDASAGAGAEERVRAGSHIAGVVIPHGYGGNLSRGETSVVPLLMDGGRPEARTAAAVVQAVVGELNLAASGARERVVLAPQALSEPGTEGQAGGGGADQGGDRYIDFFMPGVIGLTIANAALIGGLEVNAKMRQRGILRRIATTPIRKWEWVLAKVLYQAFLAAIASAVILTVAVLAFGVQVRLGWEAPVLILLGAAVFAGIAMAMSRWVKEEDQANAAGSAVAFPMMFLSGTFFPIAMMPGFLQPVARALPLTYLNEGLRAGLVSGSAAALWPNLGVVAVLAVVAVAAGSLLLEWKEV